MNTRQRGKMGEDIAVNYLKNKGYTIITTGFRSRFGEIDIIAKNKEYLTFTEVKLRKNNNFAHAREHVGKVKQRKIIATANIWLAGHKNEQQPRFDVIEIYTDPQDIIHIENAFGV